MQQPATSSPALSPPSNAFTFCSGMHTHKGKTLENAFLETCLVITLHNMRTTVLCIFNLPGSIPAPAGGSIQGVSPSPNRKTHGNFIWVPQVGGLSFPSQPKLGVGSSNDRPGLTLVIASQLKKKPLPHQKLPDSWIRMKANYKELSKKPKNDV